MLRNDIIEPSTSLWQAPVVLTLKKDHTYRFCVDFRAWNSVTKSIHYPLPVFSDVFDSISAAKAQFFSVLDMRSGFWQIPLHPETKHKTGFVYHRGTFQFKRLLMGVSNSHLAFQTCMSHVLREEMWKPCLCFIDDILCYSSTFESHLKHLSVNFSRLRSAGLC